MAPEGGGQIDRRPRNSGWCEWPIDGGSCGLLHNSSNYVTAKVCSSLPKVLADKYQTEYLGRIPHGRYAGAREVGTAVRFLASVAAEYITGAVLLG